MVSVRRPLASLTAFAERTDRYTQNYGPLSDEIKPHSGACEFCSVNRFAAAPSAATLGVLATGGAAPFHTVGALIRDGYQVLTF